MAAAQFTAPCSIVEMVQLPFDRKHIEQLGTMQAIDSIGMLLVDIMGHSPMLRGATPDLVLAITSSALGLLLRRLQSTLGLAKSISDRNYRLLVNTHEVSIFVGLNTVFACLTRFPAICNQLEEAIKVPFQIIRQILADFLKISESKPGWSNVADQCRELAVVLGYREIVIGNRRAELMVVGSTPEDRITALRNGYRQSGQRLRRRGNDVHFCFKCGKLALDEEGEAMFPACGFCKRKRIGFASRLFADADFSPQSHITALVNVKHNVCRQATRVTQRADTRSLV